MGPNEFLRDRSFWDLAKVLKEWSLLKVNIHAVAKRVMSFANKGILVHAEGVLGLPTDALEALEGSESHLLCES